ncbi:hypothetical protein GGQ72_004494 [Rhizobium rhizoryzae]|uniref:Uncharacterized protein n=1 Tax=Rhizobium rhizoryzae TaxID=451876 RepID=A0A7W6LM41_9HYPH|nr:hypothetical protein [Rhizobium rhizoryzae]
MSKTRNRLTMIAFAAPFALVVASTTAAQAADIIASYPEKAVHAPKAYHKHTTSYRPVVRTCTTTECDLLRVSYRHPYVPQTQIVEICHKPINWRR